MNSDYRTLVLRNDEWNKQHFLRQHGWRQVRTAGDMWEDTRAGYVLSLEEAIKLEKFRQEAR